MLTCHKKKKCYNVINECNIKLMNPQIDILEHIQRHPHILDMFKYGHVSKMTQAYIHWHKCLCGQFKGQLGITGLEIERNVASSESGGFWAAQERRRKCHSSKNMHPNILQFSETNRNRRNVTYITLVADTMGGSHKKQQHLKIYALWKCFAACKHLY